MRALFARICLMALAIGLAVGLFSSCSMIYEYPRVSVNSQYTLDIKNYLGNTQNIHPKVLYFEDGWNGYKFWMAYTPYPHGKTNAENPCIAVSDNGIDWITPIGLYNPLATVPKKGYNSDTHLVYDEKKDCLECWWREYDETSNSDRICRRISADGIRWSDREIILPVNSAQRARMSPAVWIEEGLYKMVFSDGARLYYISAPVGAESGVWSDPVMLPVDRGDLRLWHHDVIIDDDGDWELVICAYPPEGTNNSADLYYVRMSPDLTEPAAPHLILHRSNNKDDFDYRSIYRSSIVKVEDEYFLYYSAIDNNWRRYMAMLRGPSVFELRSLTEEEMNCN